MHEHLVLVKLADPDDGEAVVERMRTMTGRIAGMLSLDAHHNEIRGEYSYDVSLRTRFENREAYDSYVTDPVHTEVREFVVAKMVDAATCDHQVGA